MILLELFSGIGGFSKGFEKAGYPIEQTYFSEIVPMFKIGMSRDDG